LIQLFEAAIVILSCFGVGRLDDSFGAKLGRKDQNYTVSAATVLKAYLNKDFKCCDEPWD